MALFKKRGIEKRPLELPELPELPTFPELPKMPERLEMMPEMKYAAEKMSIPELPKIRPLMPISPVSPIVRDIGERQIEFRETVREPIFVKINKYREVLASFEIVKKKVAETSEILEKIKELRQTEEKQLEEWEKELTAIRERINSIDNKLFLRIE